MLEFLRVGDTTGAPHTGDTLLAFGEVHTGLLQNSTALTQDHVAATLDLVLGERVRRHERPIPHATSPDRLTGVDCLVPSAAKRDTQCVGTVLAHVSVTGGHVLQSSAYGRILALRSSRRQPWSHYLARPGTLETIGRIEATDVAKGFVTERREGVLDVGGISSRAMDEVQASPKLDRLPPFRTKRTCLRWLLLPEDRTHRAAFVVDSRTVRTLTVRTAPEQVDAVVGLCEDLALHDWLLSTLLSLVDEGFTYPGSRTQRVRRLRPAIDHLLHLWMPAARLDESVLPLWHSLEARPGFTRQWQASVDRIRDQVTLSAIVLLEAAGAS